MPISADYVLEEAAPSPTQYCALRERAGMTPRSERQATGAIAGSWAFYRVTHVPTGEVVAMGRVIGDGAWYFNVADMAVLPEHQRQGLGNAVLTALLNKIRAEADAGAYVTLIADAPGQPLYLKHGFEKKLEGSVGMAQFL